jgi:predicted membrane-bound spermidine synthase
LLALVSVIFFSFYCFRLPFLMTKDKSQLKGSLPLFVYFFCIGIGFMLIELSQVQRFSVFLGHPTYALSVVLFTLFLSTGLGSLCFGKLVALAQNKMHMLIAALLLVCAIFGVATPYLVGSFAAESTPERIAIVIFCLLPLGFVLGLGFPTGMRLGFALNEKLTPWLWGINGAASVCGSVLSIVLSMLLGISFSYWLGVVFYSLALYCALTMGRRGTPAAECLPSLE